jgi:hypothetical protein
MSAGHLIRWISRTWSILSILWILFFAINELLPSDGPSLTLQDWLALILFPIGICVGLLIGWRRPVLGGILGLAFLGSFYAWEVFRPFHAPESPFLLLEAFFLPVAAPSVLFLIGSLLRNPNAASAAKAVSK